MTDRTELRPAEREALYAPDRRLNAYYFGFESTGSPAIDAILSAVAYAGKGYHNTESWGDESRWGEGRSYVDVIQAAANEAANRVDAAESALARVRELHERASFWQYSRDQEHSYPTQQDAADESGCDCPENPESVYLAHTPECLATISHFDVCSECARIEFADADRQAHGEFSGYAEALWPCPTIAAIGGES